MYVMAGRVEPLGHYWVPVSNLSKEFEDGWPSGVNSLEGLKSIYKEREFTHNEKKYRVYRVSGHDFVLHREGTDAEVMDAFNNQVIEYRSKVLQVAQEARMLDKSAAMLIAGAACLSVRGNVWVDCNMESEWFDSSDEKNLMKFAWNEVIGNDNTATQDSLDRMSAGGRSELAGDADPRLKHITTVLKSFRKTQLTMQLYSLSPGAEAALAGLVIDAFEEFPEFSAFGDASESKVFPRSIVSEHDDRVRRMARVLRRLPLTRNEFCRVAGNILRYNISLQEGCAISTRRLNQIQSDMRIAVGVWMQFLGSNMNRISTHLKGIWDDSDNFYVFDWTTHRLKILDSEQYGMAAPAFNGSVEEEVMFQDSLGTRVCKYPTSMQDELTTAAGLAGNHTQINSGPVRRFKTPTPRNSPYMW
jgi:hypothetical protein